MRLCIFSFILALTIVISKDSPSSTDGRTDKYTPLVSLSQSMTWQWVGREISLEFKLWLIGNVLFDFFYYIVEYCVEVFVGDAMTWGMTHANNGNPVLFAVWYSNVFGKLDSPGVCESRAEVAEYRPLRETDNHLRFYDVPGKFLGEVDALFHYFFTHISYRLIYIVRTEVEEVHQHENARLEDIGMTDSAEWIAGTVPYCSTAVGFFEILISFKEPLAVDTAEAIRLVSVMPEEEDFAVTVERGRRLHRTAWAVDLGTYFLNPFTQTQSTHAVYFSCVVILMYRYGL